MLKAMKMNIAVRNKIVVICEWVQQNKLHNNKVYTNSVCEDSIKTTEERHSWQDTEKSSVFMNYQ